MPCRPAWRWRNLQCPTSLESAREISLFARPRLARSTETQLPSIMRVRPSTNPSAPVRFFTGPAIADVLGGNMKGSCKPPSDNGVWSLYELNTQIPQALNDWKKNGPKAAAPAFVCAGSNVQYSNCFSFACKRAGEINGVPVATCLCATQENLEAQPVSVGTQFITQAGQCDQSVCTEFPIGAPFQIDDIPPPACFAIPEEGLTK